MKNRFLRLAALLLAGTASLGAANSNKSEIAFSKAGQPGRLEIAVGTRNISVKGGNGTGIAVTTAVASDTARRADGLRVLSSSSGIALSEKDNVAQLTYHGLRPAPQGDSASTFEIEVPRATTIVVTGAGTVKIADITGDVEVRSTTGDIVLENLGGGALVETMSGKIDASFSTAAGKPISFTTRRGEIVLRVPPRLAANLRMRTLDGEILTDFDDKTFASRLESSSSPYGKVAQEANMARLRALEAWSDQGVLRKDQDAVAMRAQLQAEFQAIERAEADARSKELNILANVHPVPLPEMRSEKIFGFLPRSPTVPPVTGGKVVTGELNGGGVEINLATVNGDVILRQTGK